MSLYAAATSALRATRSWIALEADDSTGKCQQRRRTFCLRRLGGAERKCFGRMYVQEKGTRVVPVLGSATTVWVAAASMTAKTESFIVTLVLG